MKEKIFKTIYNLIQRGAISVEEAFYIIEAIFEKNDFVYKPQTWTTSSPYPGINITTPKDDKIEINPWFGLENPYTGSPNITVSSTGGVQPESYTTVFTADQKNISYTNSDSTKD